MAVKLRLRRMGRKKRPFYRVVAADSRSPRNGRFIEEIGYYNPLTDPATVEIKEDRAFYWLGVGAVPTPTVKNLLSRKGIVLRFDLQKKGLPEEKIEEEMKKWEVLQLEKARRLEALKAQQQKVEEKPEEPEAEAVSEEAAPAEEAVSNETETAGATEPEAAAKEETAASQETPSETETEAPAPEAEKKEVPEAETVETPETEKTEPPAEDATKVTEPEAEKKES